MGNGTRILIVDDEPTYREYLQRFLARDGLDVRTAETGAEAIELAREFSPDVLLCLLYTSPSPRDQRGSRMPSSA